MKETTRTSRTAGYLEKMFRAINQDLFAGEVEEPVITIQSTPSAYGHCSVAKVWKAKDAERHELNLGAETVNRPIENVAATLIHEMVHLLNIQRGIQDCSRGGTYHNKKFRDEAEKHLIHIDYDSRIGWSITSPTEALIDYIIGKGWEDIRMNRESYSYYGGNTGKTTTTTTTTTPKKTSSTRKYQCPKCKNSVRATKEVHIACCDCMEIMIEV